MAEEQNKQNTAPQAVAQPQTAQAGGHAPRGRDGRPDSRGGDRRNPRRSFRGDAKVKPEFDQKIISIRRVTRVVSGGRRFSFSVALVAGDRKGMVGIGMGKAGDTALAIEKALKHAKKNFVKIPTTKNMSIPYEVSAKYASSRVTISPTPGRGIVAGSSVRSVIELAGLKDVGAKLRSGSKNKINNARVAVQALRSLTPHRRVLLSQRKGAEAKKTS
jgi:small subunit ribosomal protein S5